MQQAEEGLTALVKDSHSDLCKLEKLNANLTNDLANSHRKVSEQNLRGNCRSFKFHCIDLFIIVYYQYFVQLNQVEELSMKVDKLQRQIRATKDKESITTAEMKKLKDDLSR